MTSGADGTITFGRKELIARLAAIANRLSSQHPAEDEGLKPTVHRISAYITECGQEFDLTNSEQLLFLKYIVMGHSTAEELLKGDC